MISLIFNFIFVISIAVLIYFLIVYINKAESYNRPEIQEFTDCYGQNKMYLKDPLRPGPGYCMSFDEYKKNVMTRENSEIVDCISNNKMFTTVDFDPVSMKEVKLEKGVCGSPQSEIIANMKIIEKQNACKSKNGMYVTKYKNENQIIETTPFDGKCVNFWTSNTLPEPINFIN